MLKTFNLILKLTNKNYKSSYLLIIIASFILILLDTFSLITIFPLIQSIFQENSNLDNFKFLKIFFSEKSINFTTVLVLIILLFLFKFVFTIISNYLIANFKLNLQKNLAKAILRKYLRLNLLSFLSLKQSQLIRNTTKETEIFVNSAEQFMRIFVEGSVLALLFFIIAYSFPLYTLYVSLALIICALIFNFFTKKKLLNWGKLRLIHDGYRIKKLNHIFELINEIKLLGKEESFVKLFNIDNSITQRTQRNRTLISMLMKAIIEMGIVFIIVFLLAIVHFKNYNLADIMPLIALILAVFLRLMPGFLRINNAYQLILFSVNSINEVNNILFDKDYKNEIYEKQNINFKSSEINKIELKNISFEYHEGKKKILDKINLKLETGEIIGISGKSGSGKTTMISIIMGLIKPSEGYVKLNDIDITKIILEYRKSIGYVSQNFSIIDTSLKKNITLNFENEEIDNDKLLYCLRVSGCDKFIGNLIDGFDTELGENGFKLSGGQKQRIALARALYHSKDLLIFDEATSSLDQDLSEMIYENLKQISKNKIVIIISHEKNSFKFCNRLYKLEDGKLNLLSR